MSALIRRVGSATVQLLGNVGYAARLFLRLIVLLPATFKRP